jgi:hypothetical protein
MTEWYFRAHLPASRNWVHGSKLGREHCDLATHLVEDHGTDPVLLLDAPDPALQGRHDGLHAVTRACYYDLPHGPAQQDRAGNP